jgi:hypothetical protein
MYKTNASLSKTANRTNPNKTIQNTGVLTLSEFKEMRERTQVGTLNEDQSRRHQEKVDLKDKSDSRVKNWPNTIQALRKKKDDARFERFEKEEEERRKVDIEEAKYQAGVKQEILGKANKQIYETNDRVKAFQSALLLADTLQEREAQVEITKKKKEISKMIEEHHVEVEKENMKLYDLKEEHKRLVEEEKKKVNQAILKVQHDDFKKKHIKRLQEEKIEGEIIKIKAKEELGQQREDEKLRRQKVIDAQNETKKANDLLNVFRHEEKLKDLEKDKEIEAFAKRKEEILEMRRLREELKFKEKQEARQKIIDAQVERLKKIKDREDEILSKHIKEAEIKAEENERIKQEKRAQLVKEIDKQIALTLDKRAYDKERKKVEDKNFQDFWKDKNKELESKDVADHHAYVERCKNLQDYHNKQAHQKQKKLEEEILKEFEDAQRMRAALEDEEKVFQSYAAKCLNEWDSNGKNVKPLLLELQKYKKKTT